jgi:death on curing protein
MSSGPIEPRFVTLEEALAWHELTISRYGGSLGIRDMGLLESAIAQARAGFGGEFSHSFPFEMAAAYAFHIAKNHPFVDGNKRTALMCCGGFLHMNGWKLFADGVESAEAILEIISGELDKAALADWLEAHSRPRC